MGDYMDKKEEFKLFVRKYPSYATYVKNKSINSSSKSNILSIIIT